MKERATRGAIITATFVVTNTNDSGPGSLRQAMIDANTTPGPDLILTTATGTILLASPLPTVTDDVTIQGPGIARLRIDGNNAVRVFQVAAGVTVLIQDLTIQNANSGGTSGGGIRNAGDLTIRRVMITGCTASNGGGIATLGGTLTVANCLIDQNRALNFGGGIVAQLATLSLSATRIRRNQSVAQGGGVWMSLSSGVVERSLFQANTSAEVGGLLAFFGPLTIRRSTFDGNVGTDVAGGLAPANGVTMQLSQSTFTNNLAPAGGAIFHQFADSTIINCTFHRNRASDTGSTIVAYGSGPVRASFVTIADEIVTGAGGTALTTTGSATIPMKNSIIASTTDGLGNPQPNCSGAVIDLGGNLSTDGSCGFPVVSRAALALGPLQLNPPGVTETMALGPNSVALDNAIDCNDVAGAPVLTDQRGVPRPQLTACDSGAYELRRRLVRRQAPLFVGIGTCDNLRILRMSDFPVRRRRGRPSPVPTTLNEPPTLRQSAEPLSGITPPEPWDD